MMKNAILWVARLFGYTFIRIEMIDAERGQLIATAAALRTAETAIAELTAALDRERTEHAAARDATANAQRAQTELELDVARLKIALKETRAEYMELLHRNRAAEAKPGNARTDAPGSN